MYSYNPQLMGRKIDIETTMEAVPMMNERLFIMYPNQQEVIIHFSEHLKRPY